LPVVVLKQQLARLASKPCSKLDGGFHRAEYITACCTVLVITR